MQQLRMQLPSESGHNYLKQIHSFIRMDGERKKRKMGSEEQNEEEKMNEFFALIRSTRNVRECLIRNTVRLDEKKALEEETLTVVHKPLFEVKDFVEDNRSGNRNASEEGPSKRVEVEESSSKSGKELNLNLSL